MRKKLLTWLLAACVTVSGIFSGTVSAAAQETNHRTEEFVSKMNLAGKGEQFSHIQKTDGGQASSNAGANKYRFKRYAVPVNSYLQKNTEGGFTRLEAIGGNVYLETYDASFALQSSKTLAMELPIFGGGFFGENYNFLVFGQGNRAENNEAEVMRIVKYDRNWQKISAKSIYGANTTVPFDAGSLRMAEANGILYIHTAHEMYKSSDGRNHQANMTFVLAQESMEITQEWYGVMNIGWGYVSHSFNQFVATDGNYVYRVDHGDAYPRSVVVTKADKNRITSCTYKNILSIVGDIGDNDTGVAVGGLGLTEGRLITVGNSVLQDEELWDPDYGQRNIFVSSVDTNLANEQMVWLTDYDWKQTIEVRIPHLVSTNTGYSYVLWEEYRSATQSTVVKIAKIKADLSMEPEIYTIAGRLSDCVPIYSNGKIIWYTTNGNSPTFYTVDTSKLASYDVSEKIDLNACEISMEGTSFTFEKNKQHMPTINIFYGDYQLQEGEDYTLSYTNNYYPRTASVKISGIGIFEGTVEKTYQITPIDISGYSLVLQPSEAVYTGRMYEPRWSIWDGKETIDISGMFSGSKGTDAGKYTYFFTADESDGYTGTITAIFTIKPESLETAYLVLEKTTYNYDGTAKKPAVKVILGGKELLQNKDYTVSYSNNTEVGKAGVVVEGKGNYTGTVSTAFKIIQAEHTHKYTEKITPATCTKDGVKIYTCTCGDSYTKKISSVKTVKLKKTEYIYDGKNKKPALTVKDSKGKELKKGTDYTISYPKSSKNAGTYTATIKFKGNYTGTVKKTYQVVPKTTKILKVSAKSKTAIKVQWKKQTSQTSGYEIQCSTSSKFSKAKTTTYKINKNKTTSKTISKLKKNQKYYVRVRTYKTVKVNGKSTKIYSAWSATKKVTTKK